MPNPRHPMAGGVEAQKSGERKTFPAKELDRAGFREEKKDAWLSIGDLL